MTPKKKPTKRWAFFLAIGIRLDPAPIYAITNPCLEKEIYLKIERIDR